jgi:PDZ domain
MRRLLADEAQRRNRPSSPTRHCQFMSASKTLSFTGKQHRQGEAAMKTVARVMMLAALAAKVVWVTEVSAAAQQSQSTDEVESLLLILEHYLELGKSPPDSTLDSRAKNIRERWQLLQRELLIEPVHSYLSVLPADPKAILGMSLQDYYARFDGAIVTEVLPHSPAEQAGIRMRDLIIGWNGEALNLSRPSRELIERMETVKPSDKIRLKVLRDGEVKELELSAASGEAYAKRFFETPPPQYRCVTVIAEPWLSGATDWEVLSSRKPLWDTQIHCQNAYRSQFSSQH